MQTVKFQNFRCISNLNVSKSYFLLISSLKIDRNIKLNINIRDLKQENYTKYLGVIFDNTLNWKLHIKQINLKLSKGIGVLYKLRHLVPKQSLKSLYSSFIQSHILYGISNWCCAKKLPWNLYNVTYRKQLGLSTLQTTLHIVNLFLST